MKNKTKKQKQIELVPLCVPWSYHGNRWIFVNPNYIVQIHPNFYTDKRKGHGELRGWLGIELVNGTKYNLDLALNKPFIDYLKCSDWANELFDPTLNKFI